MSRKPYEKMGESLPILIKRRYGTLDTSISAVPGRIGKGIFAKNSPSSVKGKINLTATLDSGDRSLQSRVGGLKFRDGAKHVVGQASRPSSPNAERRAVNAERV